MNKAIYQSPLGFLELREENGYITGLHFSDQSACGGDSTPLLLEAMLQLDEYFAGNRRDFELPIELSGTDFQKKVWAALRTIPFGETRSYKEIARLSGNSKAARAVGMANNKNPIAIIVPCHRVIGFDGKMVGYGGGIEKKAFLLEHENAIMSNK